MREYVIVKKSKAHSQPNHLDKKLAEEVMKHIKYTTKGNTAFYNTEPFWSLEETNQATDGLEFPEGTTQYDIWVALNFFYADTCKVLEPKQALEAGYQFYFRDEDAPEGKFGKYLQAMGLI